MNLIRAHRILIGVAIVFFCFYGYWEFAHHGAGADPGGRLRGTLALLGAAGLAVYFSTLWKRGDRDDGGSR